MINTIPAKRFCDGKKRSTKSVDLLTLELYWTGNPGLLDLMKTPATSPLVLRQLSLLSLLMATFLIAGFPTAADAGPRIKESRLERSRDDVREPLFSEWMDPAKIGDFVAKQGSFPVYQEINRKGESRVLLVDDGKRSRYYYYYRLGEEELVRRNRELNAQKYTLLTLSEDADGYFTAIWILSENFAAYQEKLKELGISLATLEE